MKRALFIGATDISDLLQYVSKVIAASGKKVLLVDGTHEKYIRYGTPLPNSKLSIVACEGFDVAIGYEYFSEIERYLDSNPVYEQLIIHCDKSSFMSKDDLHTFEPRYVAVSQEKMSIDKTIEVMTSIFDPSKKAKEERGQRVSFTKILLRYVDANMAQDFLELILSPLPITWSEEPFEFLYDEVDYAIKINNQHEGKINIRRLSRSYKKMLQKISVELSGLEVQEVKLAMKRVMRRSFTWD